MLNKKYKLECMELAYEFYCMWLKKIDKEEFSKSDFELAESNTMKAFKDFLLGYEEEVREYIAVRSEREHGRC